VPHQATFFLVFQCISLQITFTIQFHGPDLEPTITALSNRQWLLALANGKLCKLCNAFIMLYRMPIVIKSNFFSGSFGTTLLRRKETSKPIDTPKQKQILQVETVWVEIRKSPKQFDISRQLVDVASPSGHHHRSEQPVRQEESQVESPSSRSSGKEYRRRFASSPQPQSRSGRSRLQSFGRETSAFGGSEPNVARDVSSGRKRQKRRHDVGSNVTHRSLKFGKTSR